LGWTPLCAGCGNRSYQAWQLHLAAGPNDEGDGAFGFITKNP